jgi:hypothetical protein
VSPDQIESRPLTIEDRRANLLAITLVPPAAVEALNRLDDPYPHVSRTISMPKSATAALEIMDDEVSGVDMMEELAEFMSDVDSEKSSSDGEGGTTLETVAYDGSKSNSTGGVVSGLAGGRLYSFVVSAFSASGEGNRSAAMTQSTAAPAVAGVKSTAQKTTSITLAWSAPNVTTGSQVTTYLVYRNDGVSGAVTTVAYNGSATGATLGGLVGGRTYKLAVSGLSGAGEGDRSATLAQSTAPGVPGTPKSTVQTASAITLSWSAPSTGSGAKVAAYRVYESTSSGKVQRQNTTGATSATVTAGSPCTSRVHTDDWKWCRLCCSSAPIRTFPT